LNNYTAIENLTQIGKNIDNNVFTAIQEVYMRTVLLAKEDTSVKEALELADVTVIAEQGILDAVGANTILRKQEIERREFFFQLMRILERGNYTIYILGDDEKEVEQALHYIKDEFPRIEITGAKAVDVVADNTEDVINDMNTIAPKVIISVLSSPYQEKFFVEHRAMLSTKIWYAMGSGKIAGQKHSLKYMLLKKLRKYKLMNYIKEDNE